MTLTKICLDIIKHLQLILPMFFLIEAIPNSLPKITEIPVSYRHRLPKESKRECRYPPSPLT